MHESEKRFRTVPNGLSLLRIAMVPLFVSCFFADIHHNRAWAMAVFLAAGATDVIDGFIARRFHQISVWGRILDPLADKLMVFSALLCLAAVDTIPAWLVLLYFCKETAQAICGFVFMRRTKDMPASNVFGKAGTCLFYITIVALTLTTPPVAIKNTLLILSYGTIMAAFASYLLQAYRLDQINHPKSED